MTAPNWEARDAHPIIMRSRPVDRTQPYLNRNRIIEEAQVNLKLAKETARLAEVIEGVPMEQTLAAMRAQAMESIPALQPEARVRSQSDLVATRLDNVRTLLSELSDLQDFLFAEPEKVTLRPLLETLRHVESELEAAVGRLAGDLGLAAM